MARKTMTVNGKAVPVITGRSGKIYHIRSFPKSAFAGITKAGSAADKGGKTKSD